MAKKLPLGKAVQTGRARGTISLPVFLSLCCSAAQGLPESEVLSSSLMPLMDFFSSMKYLTASQMHG